MVYLDYSILGIVILYWVHLLVKIYFKEIEKLDNIRLNAIKHAMKKLDKKILKGVISVILEKQSIIKHSSQKLLSNNLTDENKNTLLKNIAKSRNSIIYLKEKHHKLESYALDNKIDINKYL